MMIGRLGAVFIVEKWAGWGSPRIHWGVPAVPGVVTPGIPWGPPGLPRGTPEIPQGYPRDPPRYPDGGLGYPGVPQGSPRVPQGTAQGTAGNSRRGSTKGSLETWGGGVGRGVGDPIPFPGPQRTPKVPCGSHRVVRGTPGYRGVSRAGGAGYPPIPPPTQTHPTQHIFSPGYPRISLGPFHSPRPTAGWRQTPTEDSGRVQANSGSVSSHSVY